MPTRVRTTPVERLYEDTFIEKIREYNTKGERYTHYIDMGIGEVMIITHIDHWNFRVHRMEKI